MLPHINPGDPVASAPINALIDEVNALRAGEQVEFVPQLFKGTRPLVTGTGHFGRYSIIGGWAFLRVRFNVTPDNADADEPVRLEVPTAIRVSYTHIVGGTGQVGSGTNNYPGFPFMESSNRLALAQTLYPAPLTLIGGWNARVGTVADFVMTAFYPLD